MAKKKSNDEAVPDVWSGFLVGPQTNNPVEGKMLGVGDSLTVKFNAVKIVELKDDVQGIVADVESEKGDTLWLFGSYGAQNGWYSLVKAADGPQNIEGKTFIWNKVVSEKSPSGFAYLWEVA